MWLRGDYDMAVLQAFKDVEVAVRVACGWPADKDHLGVTLMRKAFQPDTGPLTDLTMDAGEREALMHLFAGAIGFFKNPHSHRYVGIVSAQEAAEAIITASHLLGIVERHVRLAAERAAS